MAATDFLPGDLVAQTGFDGVFVVLGFWRGNVHVQSTKGTTHHAPPSELSLVDPATLPTAAENRNLSSAWSQS